MTKETAARLAAPPGAGDEGRLDESNRARLVAVGGAVVAVILAVFMRAGRTPAQVGALE
jgi:hypothetical protein